MKRFSDDILEQADALREACKSLDYERIVAHDPEEVEKLKGVLRQLNIKPLPSHDPLENYADKNPGPRSRAAADADSGKAHSQALADSLAREGFAERLNKVYNSHSKDRTTDIERIPHRRGLPRFDLVIAPDFAPTAGLHGIFIIGNSILSIVLPADEQPSGDWRIINKKEFSNLDEMAELVTLAAAGFDLP